MVARYASAVEVEDAAVARGSSWGGGGVDRCPLGGTPKTQGVIVDSPLGVSLAGRLKMIS